jgi:hypothetical protein
LWLWLWLWLRSRLWLWLWLCVFEEATSIGCVWRGGSVFLQCCNPFLVAGVSLAVLLAMAGQGYCGCFCGRKTHTRKIQDETQVRLGKTRIAHFLPPQVAQSVRENGPVTSDALDPMYIGTWIAEVAIVHPNGDLIRKYNTQQRRLEQASPRSRGASLHLPPWSFLELRCYRAAVAACPAGGGGGGWAILYVPFSPVVPLSAFPVAHTS